MNIGLRKDWCSALKSGKYLQTKHNLSNTTKNGTLRNCCLGVLMRIAEMTIREGQILPRPEQLKKLGLSHPAASALGRLNDAGVSFDEIAKKIQEGTGKIKLKV